MIVQDIIDRGYVLDTEYSAMSKSGKLSKLMIYDKGKDGESIWVYSLTEKYFVFFNDPLMFWGAPRAVAGMVGIADDQIADRDTCMELFLKTGQAAIDYAYKDEPK